jgi:hypothetical protein
MDLEFGFWALMVRGHHLPWRTPEMTKNLESPMC